MNTRIWSAILLLLFAPAAYAANPGDSCTAAQAGFVQTDAGSMIVCNGTIWNLALQLSNGAGRILFQVDNDAGSCTAAKTGRLRYNSADSPPWQYCDGSVWIPFDRAPVSPGYLVQTETKWNGNLGGLSGADAKCLTELQTTYDWNGKSSAGALTSSRVHALLCDGTSCNNLQPNSFYMMAKAGNAASCGWAIITDASGRGPNSLTYWDEGCYNNSIEHWTNRGTTSASQWATTPKGGNHCSNWSSSSAAINGWVGNAGNNNALRWDDSALGCNSLRFLICAVDPL